jgi:hypothetical protein
MSIDRSPLAVLGLLQRNNADGRLRLTVAGTYPLEEAPAAHALVGTGHGRGKIVRWWAKLATKRQRATTFARSGCARIPAGQAQANANKKEEQRNGRQPRHLVAANPDPTR